MERITKYMYWRERFTGLVLLGVALFNPFGKTLDSVKMQCIQSSIQNLDQGVRSALVSEGRSILSKCTCQGRAEPSIDSVPRFLRDGRLWVQLVFRPCWERRECA